METTCSHVLVCDDAVDMCHQVSDYLGRNDIHVASVNTGKQELPPASIAGLKAEKLPKQLAAIAHTEGAKEQIQVNKCKPPGDRRLEAAVIIRPLLIAALSLLPLTARSDAAELDLIISKRGQDLTSVLPLLPADHPQGTGATVTLVSLERVAGVHDLTLSAFIVDYAPGGSAVLHRAPSSGYVFVHVLSGAISASAWEAGVGTYSAGEDWAFPAFANNIATTNLSTRDPAQTLVVLVTDTPPTVPQAHRGRDDRKATSGSEFKRRAFVLTAKSAAPVGKESSADILVRMQAESSKSDRLTLPTDASEPAFTRFPGRNLLRAVRKPATHASVATLRSAGRAQSVDKSPYASPVLGQPSTERA